MTIKTIKDFVPSSLQGTPAGLLITTATAGERHLSRKKAVVSNMYRYLQEDMFWGFLLELNGVGGLHGSGVNGRTDRGPVLQQLGSGRKHAHDGHVYDTCMSEFLIQNLEHGLVSFSKEQGIVLKLRKEMNDPNLSEFCGAEYTFPFHEWINESINVSSFTEKEMDYWFSDNWRTQEEEIFWEEDERDLAAFVLIEKGYGEHLDAFLRRLVLATVGQFLPKEEEEYEVMGRILNNISEKDHEIIHNLYNNWFHIWNHYLENHQRK